MNEEKSYTTEDLLLFIDKLRHENNQLKATNESLTSLVNSCQQEIRKHKEVIEEVRDRITIKLGRYINEKDYIIDDVALDELLQILDKVKGE